MKETASKEYIIATAFFENYIKMFGTQIAININILIHPSRHTGFLC